MACQPTEQDVDRKIQLDELTHVERPEKTFTCRRCKKVFNHASSLSKHKKKCKKDDTKELEDRVKALEQQSDTLHKILILQEDMMKASNYNVTCLFKIIDTLFKTLPSTRETLDSDTLENFFLDFVAN
jgi:hypothetical protein